MHTTTNIGGKSGYAVEGEKIPNGFWRRVFRLHEHCMHTYVESNALSASRQVRRCCCCWKGQQREAHVVDHGVMLNPHELVDNKSLSHSVVWTDWGKRFYDDGDF